MIKDAGILAVLAVLACCASGLADQLHVPDEYATIQEAIDAGGDGDEVIVADGTYTGPGNRDIDFLGKAIALRSENGPESCIIDCQGTEGDPHRAFYFHTNEDVNSVLDGFTITNGYAYLAGETPEGDFYRGGGGIKCENSDPTIRNCAFVGNYSLYGGGVSCSLSTAVITNCTYSGNWASAGGAIYNSEGRAVIVGCTFLNNSAHHDGGAICNPWDSEPTVTYCTFINNTASGWGGAIKNNASNPIVTNCTFIANSSGYGGGAMSNWSGSRPIVTNCAFIGNSAARGGGAMENPSGNKPTVTNCLFSGNWAGTWGGGMYNTGIWSPTVTSCTFIGNWADQGGAICNRFSSKLNLTNCILWGNSDSNGVDESAQIYGGEPVVNYSCVQGWTGILGGIGNIDADPCFVGPGYWADANDPNIIVEPNGLNAIWVDGDHRLLRNSLCIDAGDPNYVPEPNETDLDGKARILDGNEDGTAVVDIGAYEYEFAPAIEAVLQIRPKTINLRSKGKSIMCVIRLPEDYNIADIDPNSIFLEDEIPADRVWFADEFAVAKFSRRAVQEMLGEVETPSQVELVVSGELSDGTIFEAADTIRVIDKGRRRNNMPGKAGRTVCLKRKSTKD